MKPRLLELTIERLVPGGDGLAREPRGPTAGRVVFVPGVAPGDRVLVELVREHRRRAHGRVVALRQPGAARGTPFCPLAARCGGCAWQHVAPAEQAVARAGFLDNALRHVPRMAANARLAQRPAVVAGAREGWRHRVRLHAQWDLGELRLGYRARGAHDVIDVPRCPVAAAAIGEALPGLRETLRKAPQRSATAVVTAGDEGAAAVSLRLSGDEGARVDLVPGAPPSVWRRVPAPGGGSARLRVSAGVFCQAHAAANRALIHVLLARWPALPARRPEAPRTLELYAGGGNLTVPLALAGGRLVAVERAPAAVDDLRFNLETAGVASRVEIREGEAAHETLADAFGDTSPDRIVLDPPREGAKDAIPLLVRLAPAAIVYLSCDVATLGRDLQELAGAGYALREAIPFDAFPETPHLETLAVLERTNGEQAGRG